MRSLRRLNVEKEIIEKGISEIKIGLGLSGENQLMPKSDLAYAYSKAGKLDEAKEILTDLRRIA